MGSASSKWKKVATRSPHEEPPRNGTSRDPSVSVSCRSGLDRHSEGLDSQSSGEGDGDVGAELDRILAEYQVLESSRSAPGRTGPRERDVGNDFRWTPQSRTAEETPKPPHPGGSEPGRMRDPERAREEEEDEEEGGSGRLLLKSVPGPSADNVKGLQEQLCAGDTASVPGKCKDSLLTVPVVQYDKSEEDLMETIEREFS